VESDDEILVMIHPRSRHLRAVRMLAADAGGRAGLDASEVDDLRIAVDELVQVLMGCTDDRILIRISCFGPRVVVRGSTRDENSQGDVARLGIVSELIVDAVSDHYALQHTEGRISFVVSKRAHRTVTA